MKSVLPTEVSRALSSIGPQPSPVQREMASHASETGFPIVGPEVGAFLGWLTRSIDATSVFEFGSGFGYSATWFAEALPDDDGLVVLAEVDGDELDRARDYLSKAGLAARAAFERGDAFDVFERYSGPFDVVLLDCEKSRYPEAIEPVREKLHPGGLLIADNALQGPFSVGDLIDGFAGGAAGEYSGEVAGVIEYLDRMTGHRSFDTAVIPLGEGIAVSRYTG